MTISLESLADGSVTDRNFQKLASLVMDTGGQSLGIRFGTQGYTFAAGTGAGPYTITHGLGRVPVVAFIASWTKLGSADGYCTVKEGSLTSTSLVSYSFSDVAWTGTVTSYWVVIG